MSLFAASDYITDWSLADRYLVPPFSTLDTRSGTWLARREQWNTLDLDSTNGRPANLTFAKSRGGDPVSSTLRRRVGATSTFDPVLTEIIYRWWTPTGGTILDPFAGGSTRGVVAGILGRNYHGIDLSFDQVTANQSTAVRLSAHIHGDVRWHCADSADPYPSTVTGIRADAVVTCPPYGTLERYSDDPRDLSTMRAADFRPRYTAAIGRAVQRLDRDRFAVFVVGNYREGGRLVDLVGMTIDACGLAGADYYGDLVLLNSTASAGMRASATFEAGRKAIRTHQYVLVFIKGDWRRAAAACESSAP